MVFEVAASDTRRIAPIKRQRPEGTMAKEKIVIATAAKPADLKKTYEDVKAHRKDYAFDAVTNLKEDVVAKTMTDKKKGADFVVELEVSGEIAIAQLVCDVGNGAMRSVIGRKEIKSVDDWKSAKGLAKSKFLNDLF
jgi:hypothetical protein